MFILKNLTAIAVAAILIAGCTTTSPRRPPPTYEGDLGGISPWTTCPPQEQGTC